MGNLLLKFFWVEMLYWLGLKVFGSLDFLLSFVRIVDIILLLFFNKWVKVLVKKFFKGLDLFLGWYFFKLMSKLFFML